MSRQVLFILFMMLSVLIYADNATDSKYLKGSVPEINGKVIFSKAISADGKLSDQKLFDLMSNWANENYDGKETNKNRIVFSDPQKKEIACLGEKEIIFKSSAISLDRTFLNYQLIVEVNNGKCDVTVRNLKYLYNDAGKDNLYPAENMITDKIALNKQGTKLNRYYDKFRIHTIDSLNVLFKSIEDYIHKNAGVDVAFSVSPDVKHEQVNVANNIKPSVSTSISVSNIDNNTERQGVMSGYRNVSADKIPGNYLKLLNDWTLITSGSLNTNTMTASWGGIGRLWEKPVAFCFINPSRYSISTMDEGEFYTISFYTEAYKEALQYCGTHSGRNEDKITKSGLTLIKTPSGAPAFFEAWMIIECKKILVQPISPGAVTDKESANKWSKDGYHKMYVGEILNVWIK